MNVDTQAWWISTRVPPPCYGQKVEKNSRSSYHQSILVLLERKIKVHFPSEMIPVYLSQKITSWQTFIHKQVLAKLALHGTYIINNKWFWSTGRPGKSYYRLSKLLSIHHKCPASCLCCVFLLPAACFSPSPAGNMHLPILQDPVKAPLDSTTLIFLDSSLGLWTPRDDKMSLIHSFISSLTQWIFIEHQPHARHCSRHWWWHSNEQDKVHYFIGILVPELANCGP